MKNNCLYFLFFIFALGYSQNKKVLFLGNSYTNYFNLPQLVVAVAQSTNDVIVVDSHTPGGNTLQNHNSNATSLTKIAQGNWDFVVLQEQSQLPAFPISQVETQVFPFAESLNNTIVAQNPCAETIFYMTWGRKNGDSENCNSNPSVCSYIGMDDLLRDRYLTMTNANNAIVSPVSVVWRYLRANYPTLNLYDPDESHPSILGSYIAACCFYTTILRKNPNLITFNANLSATDANIIKMATKILVFDNLIAWKVGSYDPVANFTASNTGNSAINFVNTSTNSNQYSWDFGDNSSSTDGNPTHIYANAGQFLVKLTATKCGISTTTEQTITITNLGLNENLFNENKISVYPNPTNAFIFIDSVDEIKSILIVDVFGRVIENLYGNRSSIDFTSKNNGIYFLKIQTKKNSITEKIIKQ